MGATSSQTYKGEFAKLARDNKYSQKKLLQVYEEFIRSLDGDKGSKSARKDYTKHKLDRKQFGKFCELYFNLGATEQDKTHIDHLFMAFDKDGDGNVSLEEIVISAAILDNGTQEEKLGFLFDVFDRDHTDTLDVDELGPVIQQMYATAMAMGRSVTPDMPDVLLEILASLDKDGDKIIHRKEWMQGGNETIPLLVLLGVDQSSYNVQKRVEGAHDFLDSNPRTATCPICVEEGTKKGEQGCLRCNVCHLVCCLRHTATMDIRKTPCRPTAVQEEDEKSYEHQHFFVTGTYSKPPKCGKCDKGVKEGRCCAWCRVHVHRGDCERDLPKCDLGRLAPLIIPATGFRIKRMSNAPGGSPVPPPARLAPVRNGDKTIKHKPSFVYEELARPMEVVATPGSTPLVVFINSGSGGQQGMGMMKHFNRLLNQRQVFDLQKQGPAAGLRQFLSVPNVRILACGGDGTVGWVLSELDKINTERARNGQAEIRPPVAILPLGTGNDLARCFDWGGGFDNTEKLDKVLEQVIGAKEAYLDRWSVEITPKPSANGSPEGDPIPLNIINNYFSIGVDAQIARKFHNMREKNPQRFSSRIKNKLWYAELGGKEALSSTCKDLHKHITVKCDGQQEITLPAGYEGLALLNILTMYGGSDVWGSGTNEKWRPQGMDDGWFELAGLGGSTHVGSISTGVRHGKRLAQCKECVIDTTKALPMQIDGEPWLQGPCTIRITFKNRATMLKRMK